VIRAGYGLDHDATCPISGSTRHCDEHGLGDGNRVLDEAAGGSARDVASSRVLTLGMPTMMSGGP